MTPEATNYCTYNDSHPCMLRNCECDEQLAKTLARYYESKDFSTQYVTNLDGTGFDHTNRCVAGSKDVGAGLDESENVVGMPLGLSSWTIECCGSYPHRVPYKKNRSDYKPLPSISWAYICSSGSLYPVIALLCY